MDIRKKFYNCPYIAKPTDTMTCYSLFGLETPRGWNKILLEMLDEWEKVCKKHREKEGCIYVSQIKEKYAQLRVYFHVVSDNEQLHKELDEIAEKAEEASYTTCQICGKKGQERNHHGWYSVLCDECNKEDV